MLGVNYESSDEEETVVPNKADTNTLTKVAPTPELPSRPALSEQSKNVADPISGPSQGPMVPSSPSDHNSIDGVPPGSPYTSNRTIIQNLTLPTVPNFDIPPSPPGSPPREATRKFAQFLELKNKGQHFNQRLEGSSVLRDPGHLRRLLDFAAIGDEEQYASTLSENVAVPVTFSEWAYADQLRVSQKQILKAKDYEKSKTPRGAIDFVSGDKTVVNLL
ncbi:HCNGP-like protein-domain-containing protein [Phaeosphaeriaceae sp. PMI808]|nr:HCNGP-like protein-domain-containing protein [Phaeosphaeriaceae sp. PMI808]